MATIDFGTVTDIELRKALAIPFLTDSAQAELARREEKAKVAAKAALASLQVKGFTFSDGTAMDFLALVDFLQRTLALSDTDPKAMWETVLEARTALGDAYPTKNKWKTLEAYKTL
jgi:hypothetical protein